MVQPVTCLLQGLYKGVRVNMSVNHSCFTATTQTRRRRRDLAGISKVTVERLVQSYLVEGSWCLVVRFFDKSVSSGRPKWIFSGQAVRLLDFIWVNKNKDVRRGLSLSETPPRPFRSAQLINKPSGDFAPAFPMPSHCYLCSGSLSWTG
jgi:hypothetical protein